VAGKRTRNIVERFFSRVEKTETCWLWQGKCLRVETTGRGGYGLFSDFGKWVLAHRWAYASFIGTIPDGTCVLHKCDVRNCVNPDHLFIGTHQDNTRDMFKKGRGRQTLTEQDVVAIRALLREPDAVQAQIARQFGVTRHQINAIAHNRSWRAA
jgi:hypothetical protein